MRVCNVAYIVCQRRVILSILAWNLHFGSINFLSFCIFFYLQAVVAKKDAGVARRTIQWLVKVTSACLWSIYDLGSAYILW